MSGTEFDISLYLSHKLTLVPSFTVLPLVSFHQSYPPGQFNDFKIFERGISISTFEGLTATGMPSHHKQLENQAKHEMAISRH